MKICTLFAVATVLYFSLNFSAQANVWEIGANKNYKVPSAVSSLVAAGDTINIGAGEYLGDVAVWSANKLLIRGIGGKAIMNSNGSAAQGKAIWVIQGDSNVVENIEFSNCKVPDQNGAGIRLEGSGFTARKCYFHDNEEGILAENNANSYILIEFCEFARNSFGDGYSHNLYIDKVKSLVFRDNYSHGAKVGHDFKSRAETNVIYCNRIMDESDGTASYLIDLPNGGNAAIVGNILQKGANAENRAFISYGGEGFVYASNKLFAVNNTMISDKSSCTFFNIYSGADSAVIANNIFGGAGIITSFPADTFSNIYSANISDLLLEDVAKYDYRPLKNSPAIDNGANISSMLFSDIIPQKEEYSFDCDSVSKNITNKIDIGAFEFSGVLGIQERASNIHYIYPNPASERFTIINNRFTGEAFYEIYDYSGKLIRQGKAESANNAFEINASELISGVFYLLLKNNTLIERYIFVKK